MSERDPAVTTDAANREIEETGAPSGPKSGSGRVRPPPRSPFLYLSVALIVVLGAVGGVAAYVYTHPAAPGIVCHHPTGNASTVMEPAVSEASIASLLPQAPIAPLYHPAAGAIQVVAAENFWGSLVSQIGGNDTSVLSIITDPNTDPHEYQQNNTVVQAIANAQYVIVNGVGYDTWAIQDISTLSHPPLVLNVGDLNGVPAGGNPHQWYNPTYVNNTIAAMLTNLTTLAPQDASYFDQNFHNLTNSLNATIFDNENDIRALFAGTEVAATESIFVYMANALHLDLVSPPAFMQAVAEGNDPPEQSVSEFENQLESGDVKVLVYNKQTVTPLTSQMETIAQTCGVSVTFVTETIQPPNYSFQVWMEAELIYLQNALNAQALGN